MSHAEPVKGPVLAWKEAAIAWTVCASVHRQWAKGKDALYSTRQADFNRHADDARTELRRCSGLDVTMEETNLAGRTMLMTFLTTQIRNTITELEEGDVDGALETLRALIAGTESADTPG